MKYILKREFPIRKSIEFIKWHGYGSPTCGFKGLYFTINNPRNIIIGSARKFATDEGYKMNVAVVDAGANLKGFLRMDGAWLGSVDIAVKKAETARYFDMPTGEIGKLSQPGGALFGIEHSNGGLITFPGGIPLENEAGDVIGAVGVSGGAVEEDHATAEAGTKAL